MLAIGGRTAAAREKTDPMSQEKPLAPWRVLVTRPVEQSKTLIDALTVVGATAVPYPTIAVGPPPSWSPFDHAFARIHSYSWIVFSSPSAARFAFGHAPDLTDRLRSPGAPRVAAVGNETAKAIAACGVQVGMVPDDQRQEGLVAAFESLPRGTQLLFPQAVGGREFLREALASRGIVVDVVPVSETVALSLPAPPPAFDVALFASPSALRAFVAALTAAPLVGKVVAVIGPTTSEAAREAGVRVDVLAPSPSVSALVGALCAYRHASAID
jgi:uroporphyrinogen III methyltransferase/synthase